MKVYGLSREELYAVMHDASDVLDGNLTFNREPEMISKRNSGFALTLRVLDSHGTGAKSGPSGRATIHANYGAHYQFMARVFEINPDARILTAMETYEGIGEFEDKADAVYYRNAGSMIHPVAYGDM